VDVGKLRGMYDFALLEFLREPATRVDCIRHFGTASVSTTISRLFKDGLLVKSTPVKVRVTNRLGVIKESSRCFYCSAEVMRSGGSVFVPAVNRYVKFYHYDAWHRLFSYGKTRISGSQVLAYLQRVKAATAREVADEFRVPVTYVSGVLNNLLRSGKIVRRGKTDDYGRDVKISRVGFVYGVDYEAINAKVKEILASEKLAPVRARVLARVDADSRQGELTAQVVFRNAPFNLTSAELVKIIKYMESHSDYGIARWGSHQWFYNKRLILQVLTEEELENKIKSFIDTAKSRFNVKLLAGIAVEIAVRKALELCPEFDQVKQNVYIPTHNPWGKEFDFVATKTLLGNEKVYPLVYIGEVKLAQVGADAIRRFYEKLRHTSFVPVSSGDFKTLEVSHKVKLKLAKDVSVPIRVIRGNVVPVFVAAAFTKEAIEECKKYGVVWMYVDFLLEMLGRRKRKRIYGDRIRRLVKSWVMEIQDKVEFVSRKDVYSQLEKMLNSKLGI